MVMASPEPPSKLKPGSHLRCGVGGASEHTLDEVMEAPQVIKHMLNDEGGLGRTYLGVRCGPCSCLRLQS